MIPLGIHDDAAVEAVIESVGMVVAQGTRRTTKKGEVRQYGLLPGFAVFRYFNAAPSTFPSAVGSGTFSNRAMVGATSRLLIFSRVTPERIVGPCITRVASMSG